MLKEIFYICNYSNLANHDIFTDKLVRLLKVYGILFLTLIIATPMLGLADKYITHILHHKSLLEQNKQTFEEMYKRIGKPTSIFYICLLGPLCEELLFRFGLSFNKRHVAVSASFALFYIGRALLRTKANEGWIVILIALIMLMILMILCRYIIPNTAFNLSPRVQQGWIITSITLFGLTHIFNFRPVEWGLIWIYPVFVIPQLLMGWGITYVRFKNGFLWGWGLHCLINTVATVLSLWIKK